MWRRIDCPVSLPAAVPHTCFLHFYHQPYKGPTKGINKARDIISRYRVERGTVPILSQDTRNYKTSATTLSLCIRNPQNAPTKRHDSIRYDFIYEAKSPSPYIQDIRHITTHIRTSIASPYPQKKAVFQPLKKEKERFPPNHPSERHTHCPQPNSLKCNNETLPRTPINESM